MQFSKTSSFISLHRNPILGCILLLTTFIVYQPAWKGSQLWDDDAHITRPELRSLEGLGRIWTHLGATQQYYPIVHSAFWLEYKLWKDTTLYYHLVNILLHAFSALILIRIIRGLKISYAWVIGAVFALHPIQVESVAWITELKNTLSGVFFLLAAFWYLKFDEKRKRIPYAISFCFFIFGLLSKSMIATLPASLLAVVWWKRGKLELKRDIGPIAPFFIIGVLSGLFTAWMEHTHIIGKDQAWLTLSFLERCLIAGRAFWFYLWKLFWPGELIFIYPRWHIIQSQVWQYAFPLAAVICAALCWVLRKRWRFPLVIFIYFTATLFPAMGFFNVYPFKFSFVADHFQYLACIGPLLLAVTGLKHAIGKTRKKSHVVSFVILLGLLCFLTWKQSALYSDSETLFRAVLKKNENSWLAHNNLGLLLWKKGNGTEALAHFQKTLEINPNYAKAHFNVGTMKMQFGDVDTAIVHFKKAMEIDPAYFDAYLNLGSAFTKIGLIDSAIAYYRRAMEMNPKIAESSFSLANIYSQIGKIDEAIASYRKTLESKPEFVDAHSNLGALLARTGNTDEAIVHLKKALEMNPALMETWFTLGNLLFQKGKINEAILCYNNALEIDSQYAKVHNNLGIALSQSGRIDEAIIHYRKAVEINPFEINSLQNFVFALLLTGRREEATAALSHVAVLAKSNGKEPLVHDIEILIDKIKQMMTKTKDQ